MLVYRISNIVNGKIYIGITSRTLLARWRGHVWKSTCKGRKSIFCTAIRKYGAGSFKREVLLDGLSVREAKIKEIELIRAYACQHPGGYNMSTGGESASGTKRTARVRRLRREYFDRPGVRKAYSERTKKQWSEETFRLTVAEAVSRCQKGKKRSRKFCKQVKQRMLGNKHLLGFRHSLETWTKISLSNRGRKPSLLTRQKARERMIERNRSGKTWELRRCTSSK